MFVPLPRDHQQMPGQKTRLTWHYDASLYAPAKYRKACRYEAFLPDLLENTAIALNGDVAGVVSDAEAAIRALNDSARPALEPLARLLLRTESIASSKVEGMQLGVRELARAEARVDTGGKAGSTAVEILANIDAMELAVRDSASVKRVSVKQLTGIHRRLMQKSPNPRIAGEIRTRQNWIGGNDYNPCGADFVPPPPEGVSELLTDLCQAINDEGLPPIVQAALVHAQFETIHPFDDGNGRTGRALIHVVLKRRKLAPDYVPPISIILAANRARYVEGLTEFRFGDISQWIVQFATSAAQAATLAKAYLVAVEALKSRWKAMLSSTASVRSDAAAWAIIDALPAHPMITAAVASAATGRSRAPIYEGLRQLESAGVLIPLTKSQRNQSWEVSGLLDLIAGLEDGRLPPLRRPE
jgi:Fic family protein